MLLGVGTALAQTTYSPDSRIYNFIGFPGGTDFNTVFSDLTTDHTGTAWGFRNDTRGYRKTAGTGGTVNITSSELFKTVSSFSATAWQYGTNGSVGLRLFISTDGITFTQVANAGKGNGGSFSASTGPILDPDIRFIRVQVLDNAGVSYPGLHEVVINFADENPGGESTDLALWLRADEGTNTTVNGDAVTFWADQSGMALHASQETATSPTLNTTALHNFNPTISFHNNLLRLVTDPANNNIGRGDVNYNLRVVLAPDPQGTTWSGVNQRNWSGHPSISGVSSGMRNAISGNHRTLYNNWINRGTVNSGPNSFRIDEPNIFGWVYDADTDQFSFDINGNKISLHTVGDKGNGVLTFIGGFRSNAAIIADFAEVVVYNAADFATLRQVDSYLALKYGITLDQSVTGDYVASDGSTLIWDQSFADSGFNNDIFGIGRDNGSNLHQRASRSGNPDAVITLATSNDFASLSSDNSRTDLSNLNFLTVANNDGTATWEMGANPNAPNGFRVIDREWQVQKTSGVNPIHLQFDMENTSFDIPATQNGTTYYIVTDPNGDGNYTDGVQQRLTHTGDNLWSTSLNLTHGSKFTLAMPIPKIITNRRITYRVRN
ncbi:MAG: hypothetical protein AAFX53_09115 [Bacteroidota bacterium]